MDWRRSPGWIVSAAAHGALLVGLVIALPDARKFTDAQETVPVEILTEEQVNQIVKGDKQAQKQNPNERADKVAEKPESNPEPPIAEAQKNIPTPPPPLKRLPDPGEDDTPKPAEPAPKVAALPPPKPERESEPEPPPAPAPPVRPPEPAKPTAAEPPKPVEKEALVPMPPIRPKIEPQPEPKPEVKKVAAKPPEKPVTEPPEKTEPPVPLPPQRPRDLPKVVKTKPQPDRIAKLIEQRKRDDSARARPKSGDDSNEPQRKFDRNAISNLLQSKEDAQRRASTGRQVQRQSRLGSPTASAAKMSPSMWGQLDGLMQEQYKRCWSYLGLASGKRYIPQVRVSYAASGQLTSAPVLLNPPADPALRSLAESAVRAVRKCDPLRIPAQFAPFHDQWKSRVLRFDPEEMMG